jgi:23S rRNA pseudouridine1911/1915/1917 synthase
MPDSPDALPSDPEKPLRVRVGKSIKERRIDKYLHGRFSNLSRRFMQDAIKSGSVKVNGQPVKPSFKLSPGDLVDVVLPEPPTKEITPEDIPIDVLYEDEDLIVINKRAGIVVHPARGNTHGTLVNALTFYSDNLSSGLGDFRPGIVHRLDKNTTGVMVVTKNDSAQWQIARQFELRQTQKEYLAIVHGTPQLDRDRINAPLGMHPRIREKYAVRPQKGKEAITDFEVLESFRGYSLLKCLPKTGRTHQIRVHLAHTRHPIVADGMYGGKPVYPWQLRDDEATPEDPIVTRCALHAFRLSFTHPATEEVVTYEAPLAGDMSTLLDMLRTLRSQ